MSLAFFIILGMNWAENKLNLKNNEQNSHVNENVIHDMLVIFILINVIKVVNVVNLVDEIIKRKQYKEIKLWKILSNFH